MENNRHKGSEFNNISETWDKNEQARNSSNQRAVNDDEPTTGNPLDDVIRQEAAAYDSENKEDQLLSGDRATLNDEAVDADDSGE